MPPLDSSSWWLPASATLGQHEEEQEQEQNQEQDQKQEQEQEQEEEQEHHQNEQHEEHQEEHQEDQQGQEQKQYPPPPPLQDQYPITVHDSRQSVSDGDGGPAFLSRFQGVLDYLGSKRSFLTGRTCHLLTLRVQG